VRIEIANIEKVPIFSGENEQVGRFIDLVGDEGFIFLLKTR